MTATYGNKKNATHRVTTAANITKSNVHAGATYWVVKLNNPTHGYDYVIAVPGCWVSIHNDDIANVERKN